MVPHTRPAGRLRIVYQGGADAGHLVGGDARPRSGPAADDAFVCFSSCYSFSHLSTHQWPIRLFLIGNRTEGDNLVTSLFEFCNQGVCQFAALVAADRGSHHTSSFRYSMMRHGSAVFLLRPARGTPYRWRKTLVEPTLSHPRAGRRGPPVLRPQKCAPSQHLPTLRKRIGPPLAVGPVGLRHPRHDPR